MDMIKFMFIRTTKVFGHEKTVRNYEVKPLCHSHKTICQKETILKMCVTYKVTYKISVLLEGNFYVTSLDKFIHEDI